MTNEARTKDFAGTFNRGQVVEVLAEFRKAWENEAQGESLLNVPVNIGYVFGDLTLILNLTTEEQFTVLGPKLRKEFFRAIR